MRVLVTGAGGQVGRALARVGWRRGDETLEMPRALIDITRCSILDDLFIDVRPDVVINCAAYTAVDAAESDRAAAFAVNAVGAGNVARTCAARGIPLLHLSTDYVFDGTATRSYREDDPIGPLSTYGASKALGEAEVRSSGGISVRTSGVFSQDCGRFVRTIARAAVTKPVLRVVDDQISCPTYADDLAEALFALAQRAVRGDALDPIYHACNTGPITWCGLAREIVELVRARARSCSQSKIACPEVTAITTAEYPTAARRPAYSVLDTSRLRAIGIELPSWRPGLAIAVRELLDKDVTLPVEGHS